MPQVPHLPSPVLSQSPQAQQPHSYPALIWHFLSISRSSASMGLWCPLCEDPSSPRPGADSGAWASPAPDSSGFGSGRAMAGRSRVRHRVGTMERPVGTRGTTAGSGQRPALAARQGGQILLARAGASEAPNFPSGFLPDNHWFLFEVREEASAFTLSGCTDQGVETASWPRGTAMWGWVVGGAEAQVAGGPRGP